MTEIVISETIINVGRPNGIRATADSLYLRVLTLGYDIGRASGTNLCASPLPQIEIRGYSFGRASGTLSPAAMPNLLIFAGLKIA